MRPYPVADKEVNVRKVAWSVPLIESEEQEAAIRVIRSGWMTQGKETEWFEKELSQAFNVKHVIVVNNGTSALIASLLACGIGRGDEVLVPTMTFVATVNVLLMLGAKPILVDCDPKTLNVTPEILKSKLTARTKAFVFVDVYGMPCDIEALEAFAREHGLILIEDAAQAIGAGYRGRPIGSFSHPVAGSFHMAKLIAAAEGGCVMVQDDELALKLRRIRNHGMARQYEFVTFGLNLRITDVQSATGRVQLRKLPRMLEHRERLVQQYKQGLRGLVEFQEIPSYVTTHPHMIFSVFFSDRKVRDEVNAHLNQQGIDTRICFPPVHKQPYHQPLFADQGPFPNAEDRAERVLSLPMGNGLTSEDVDYVVQTLKEALVQAS